ncbi:hypothetical protein CHELA1G11_12549 [Hyphomicrobiales bacterium]|nr:hypothetical protein CHELA1G2_11758 [Hyphomicrobiales bacterium]CAH1665547.1 hypothetical protein CHELA1G11_12549 [Hyphomicrobiales bacterium]
MAGIWLGQVDCLSNWGSVRSAGTGANGARVLFHKVSQGFTPVSGEEPNLGSLPPMDVIVRRDRKDASCQQWERERPSPRFG